MTVAPVSVVPSPKSHEHPVAAGSSAVKVTVVPGRMSTAEAVKEGRIVQSPFALSAKRGARGTFPAPTAKRPICVPVIVPPWPNQSWHSPVRELFSAMTQFRIVPPAWKTPMPSAETCKALAVFIIALPTMRESTSVPFEMYTPTPGK